MNWEDRRCETEIIELVVITWGVTVKVSTGSEEEDEMTGTEEGKGRPAGPDCLLASAPLPLCTLLSTAGTRGEKLHFPESPANKLLSLFPQMRRNLH